MLAGPLYINHMKGTRMDKIVYLFGSARDAATRVLRRGNFPREMVVRLGEWTIRPSRRTAVEFVRLAPYATDLMTKVQNGVLKVQKLDLSDVSLEELRAGFESLGADAPNYDTMPLAELHALLRAENPEPAARAALARRMAQPVPAAPPPPSTAP